MKLFQRIANWLRARFDDLSDLVEERADDAVILTQLIKESIETQGGSLEWVFEQLNSKKLYKLHSFAKAKLPGLIKELSLIDGLADSNASREEAWNAYTSYISGKLKSARAKEWIDLSAKILGVMIAKKAPQGLLVIAAQFAFEKLFGKKD